MSFVANINNILNYVNFLQANTEAKHKILKIDKTACSLLIEYIYKMF